MLHYLNKYDLIEIILYDCNQLGTRIKLYVQRLIHPIVNKLQINKLL